MTLPVTIANKDLPQDQAMPKKKTFLQKVWAARMNLLYSARMREIIFSLILLPICLLWIYPFLWMVSASLKTNG